MRKVRVAFFAEILIEEFDGASRTMFQLIKRINPGAYEFLFIYGAGPENIFGFEGLRIPSVNIPLNNTYTMALPDLAIHSIKDKLKAFKPDVIHIATPSILGNFALKYAVKHKIPIISIYHTHFISYIDYYLKHVPFLIKRVRKMVAARQKIFYNQCNCIYVPSVTIMEELKGIGIEEDRMSLWKRGIDTTLFSPEHKDMEMMRGRTGNDWPTIMFASRLVWEKNLETLFKIYEQVQASYKQVNFLIVGDGIAATNCKAVMKNAIFTGKVDHQTLAKLYASATLFLFPSVSETYGNVVIEAMASGLPCVIADGGGSRDFIEQGVNGFKCEPYYAANYTGKIIMLLENEALRKQFGNSGVALSRLLSWEQLAERYFDDVKHLVKSTSDQ
jgi:glycosyltransferase involved in cell wall biosynthesis